MPFPHIKLTVVAYHGQTLVDGAHATFDSHGGTIGRDNSNSLALPGDDGLVARHHAAVTSQGGHWQLLNTSGCAAIAINGKMLAPGEQTGLQAGDIINLGAYVLQASADALPPAWDLPALTGTGRAGACADAPAPAWDLPALAALAGPERTNVRADVAEPLRFEMPAVNHPEDPLTGLGPTAGTADLLDTPLDPLLLFGTSPAWSGTIALEPPGLFADLPDARPLSTFDASDHPRMHGHAVRDAVPEHGSHLRLQIASPAPASGSAPEYGAQFGAPTVLRPAGPIRIVGAAAAPPAEPMPEPAPERKPVPEQGIVPPPSRADHEASDLPAQHHAPTLHELARHFLDGAGIEPGSAAAAGLNREFMYALGKLIRGLMPPRS